MMGNAISGSRLPLTPYDRMFLASHLLQTRGGLPGQVCMAEMELEGELDAALLAVRFAEVLSALPVLRARIAYTRLMARAYWKIEPGADAARAELPMRTHDLRGHRDPEAARRTILLKDWRTAFDPARGPHVRLVVFRLADDQWRLMLFWPHYLMDMEGVRMLLRALDGSDPVCDDAPAEVEYPPTWSGHLVRRWLQAARQENWWRPGKSCRLSCSTPATADSAEYVLRSWPEHALPEIVARAGETCAPGPALVTRYFLVALLRAMDDLHEELGFHDHDRYLLPLPMGLPRATPRRVIARNELTIATLAISRRLIARPRELDEELCRQIADYVGTGLDEAAWTLMRYAGLMRIKHYQWALQRRRTYPRYSMGFTSYRSDPWERSFFGCRVKDLRACGLPLIPPGVLISFYRHGDRATMGAGYFTSCCPRARVERLLDRLGEHLGIGTDARPEAAAAQQRNAMTARG